MKAGRSFLTVCVMAALLAAAAGSTAQSTSKVYGYVSYGGVPVNGAIVTLSNEASGQNVTQTMGGQAGYYELYVNPGAKIVVTAVYNDHSTFRSYVVNAAEVRIDLDISTATPTPTVTPTPTPTPRPSQEPGGLVVRNDTSSFKPAPLETTITPRPTPVKLTPTPTIAPTPTPTPTPSPGLLSNIYIWAAIVLVAILIITAAALIYLRK